MIELFKILLLKKKGALADMQDFPYLLLILHRKGKAICRNPHFYTLLMRAEQHEAAAYYRSHYSTRRIGSSPENIPISILQIQKSALFLISQPAVFA